MAIKRPVAAANISPFRLYREATDRVAKLAKRHADVIALVTEANAAVASAAEALKVHARTLSTSSMTEHGVTVSITSPMAQKVHLDILRTNYPKILLTPGVVKAVDAAMLDVLAQLGKLTNEDVAALRYSEPMTRAVTISLKS